MGDGMPFDGATVILAFDRSVRFKDQDGRLHVTWTNISKATVNPYYGREIPGADALGLDPDRVYQLLRHPDELAKAAPTFNRVPLMSKHIAVSAADPQEMQVAGALGSDAEFRPPFLGNSLVIWRQEDIDDVESREKCELSCAYYYEYDPTPGEYQGLRYDGVMRNIRANHVALVPAGRAGPDVMVHDGAIAMPQALASRKALIVKGALTVYLKPKLMTGTVLALDSALGSVNRLNWQTQKPLVLAAITSLAMPKLAQDATLSDLPAFLGALDAEEDGEEDDLEAMDSDLSDEEREEEREARDAEMKAGKTAKDRKAARDARRTARDAKRASDKAAKDARAARDARRARDAESEEEREKREAEERKAEDARRAKDRRAMDAEIAATETRVIARMNAIAEAREIVRPYIGQVPLAMDSAPAVYKLALDALKVDTTGVPEAGFKALLSALPKPGAARTREMAMDSASAHSAVEMFPSLARINQA